MNFYTLPERVHKQKKCYRKCYRTTISKYVITFWNWKSLKSTSTYSQSKWSFAVKAGKLIWSYWYFHVMWLSYPKFGIIFKWHAVKWHWGTVTQNLEFLKMTSVKCHWGTVSPNLDSSLNYIIWLFISKINLVLSALYTTYVVHSTKCWWVLPVLHAIYFAVALFCVFYCG